MPDQSLYVDRDRFFQRLDPVAKLALIVALSAAAFIFTDPLFIVVPLVFSLAAIVYSGGFRNIRRIGFIIVAVFFGGLVVWTQYTAPSGPVLLDLGVFRVTRGEFRFALGRSERIVTFLLAGVLYITTTSNEEIVQGLRRLGFPYAFCFAVGTALRLFPTFLDATTTVKQAQEARGQEFDEGNFIKRVRSYVPLIIPVLMTAFQKVDSQSMALEARGFDPGSERSFYQRQRMRPRDYGVIVASAVVVVGSLGLRIADFGVV